ncbi:MAG TPA: type II toxin-antitoxin system RelE/ParE family toxin [Polyangiaceae bacterium]|nr:type II toxin-antitoxin system RelE/ParE family toxin [Polyangiaceae bacterium]
MSYRVAPQAARDLRDALTFLVGENPDAAESLLASFGREFELLASGIVEGAQTTLRSGRRVRRWLVHPFWVYYRRTPAGLEILRVYHHARRPLER